MTQEVKAKLVLDDAASAALNKIKSGFEHIGHQVSHVQSELVGMVKQTIAVAAGFQLSAGIDSLKELGMEAFHAADANEQQIKSLAGLVAMTDKTGMSYEEMTKQGAELKEQLEKISIGAGATADSVIDAFSLMAERSTKSKEEIVELTSKMAMASRALPGGVTTLASAFRDLESGIVRPRNAIVQMLRTTGAVKGSAREIAKGLSQMMQSGDAGKAKVFELAEKAMGRMADKMKNAPMTFQETINGLKTLRENIFEAMGGPMVKAITPALENLKKYLVANKDKIEHFAEVMGEKVGHWAVEAADKMEEAFKYLQSHADEIQKAIESGVKMAKEVVQFIIAHKEEIAIAYGVKTVAPLVGGAMNAAKGVGSLATAAGGIASAGIPALGIAGSAAAAGAAGAALSLGLFVVAIGSVATAAYMGYELLKEKSADQMDVDAKLELMHKAAADGQVETAQRMHDEIVKLDPSLAMAQMTGGLLTQAENMKKSIQIASDAFNQEVSDLGSQGNDDALVRLYADAAKRHDEAQQERIINEMAGNQKVIDAFKLMGNDVLSGAGDLAERLKKVDLFTGVMLAKEQDKRKKENTVPNAMNVNIGKMEIKQDFRDQDPDRVVAVFQRDFANKAISRIQTNRATPFGL